VLIDASILIYAVDRRAERHEPAAAWLSEQLNGAATGRLPVADPQRVPADR